MSISNVMTTKEIDVIELFSRKSLILETNTQIELTTSNLLMNYIPFHELIRNIVFGESYSETTGANVHTQYGQSTTPTNKIDLTLSMNNDADLIIDELNCRGITTNNSYVNTDTIHYINIKASEYIHLSNRNVVYNSTTLSNYIYNVLNSTSRSETVVDHSIDSTMMDISSMGGIHTNRITSSNISTKKVAIASKEPPLKISSPTAINFSSDISSNIVDTIYIGDTLLRNYIYQFLDETPRGGVLQVFHFFVNIENGASITMSYLNNEFGGFSNSLFGDTFEYSITYKIFNEDVIDFTSTFDLDSYDLGSMAFPKQNIDVNVKQGVYDSTSIEFDNLTAGNFYRIYADITNLRTNTIVRNVGPIETNIATIPHINVTNIIITVLNERQIQFSFLPHQIQLSEFPMITFTMKLLTPTNTDYINHTTTPNPTQNITLSVYTDPLTFIFDFDTSELISSYGQPYIKKDVSHEFVIQSTALPSFVMISESVHVNSQLDVLHFRPEAPRSLTVSHVNSFNYQFSITPETQALFEHIEFAVKYDPPYGTSSYTSYSTSSTFTHNFGDVIPSGTYYAICRNVYGTESEESTNGLTINDLNVVLDSTNINNDQTRIIYFTVTGNYNDYTVILSGNNVGANKTGTNINNIVSNTIPYGNNNFFTITVTDDLQRTYTVQTSTFNVEETSNFSIGNLTYVTGTNRIYRATVNASSATYNVSWGITTGGSATNIINEDATIDNVTASYIDFQIPNFTSSKEFTYANIIITDRYGYTFTVGNRTTITPSFGTTPTLTLSAGRRITATDGFSSYSWSGNGTSGSNNFSIVNNSLGTVTCVVEETNDYGFTMTHTLTYNVYLPSIIASPTFVITGPSSYEYSFTMNGNNRVTYDDVINPAPGLYVQLDGNNTIDYRGFGEYTLQADLIDSYGFSNMVEIASYTVELPAYIISTTVNNDLSRTLEYYVPNDNSIENTKVYVENFWSHKSLTMVPGTTRSEINTTISVEISEYYTWLRDEDTEEVYKYHGTLPVYRNIYIETNYNNDITSKVTYLDATKHIGSGYIGAFIPHIFDKQYSGYPKIMDRYILFDEYHSLETNVDGWDKIVSNTDYDTLVEFAYERYQNNGFRMDRKIENSFSNTLHIETNIYNDNDIRPVHFIRDFLNEDRHYVQLRHNVPEDVTQIFSMKTFDYINVIGIGTVNVGVQPWIKSNTVTLQKINTSTIQPSIVTNISYNTDTVTFTIENRYTSLLYLLIHINDSSYHPVWSSERDIDVMHENKRHYIHKDVVNIPNYTFYGDTYSLNNLSNTHTHLELNIDRNIFESNTRYTMAIKVKIQTEYPFVENADVIHPFTTPAS